MAGPVQIVKDANKYLNLEISKGWALISVKDPSYSSARPKGALTKNNTVIGFTIGEYWSHRVDGKVVLRVKEKFKSFNWAHDFKYKYFSSGTEDAHRSDAGGLELTFLSDEIETVIPWLLDNYLEVKSIPEWLDEKHTDRIKVGEPAFFYLWTKNARASYELGRKRA